MQIKTVLRFTISGRLFQLGFFSIEFPESANYFLVWPTFFLSPVFFAPAFLKRQIFMNQKIKAPFSIGDTARMTGVTRRRIRSWEARRYIPEVYRVVCGERAYRYFTPEQIEIIRKIKGYLDQGYTLAHASKMARDGR